MPEKIEDLRKSLKGLEERIKKEEAWKNRMRRFYFEERRASIQTLMQAENLLEKAQEIASISIEDLNSFTEEINQLEKGLILKCHPKPKSPIGLAFFYIDSILRLVTCAVYFVVLGMCIFGPLVTVVPVLDWILGLLGFPHRFLFQKVRIWVSSFFCLLAGVFFTVEGMKPRYHNESLLLFQHGSNLDAFFILACFPQNFRSIGKDDIFLIPYVGWMAYLFGVLPITRSDRASAIKQLARGVQSLKNGVVLALSPEGTRSKTGQLQRFKKGPFYVMEETKATVIPLVIMGSFVLWPPNEIFARSGNCLVRFLEPIPHDSLPKEGEHKDYASKLVRKQMFQSIHEISTDKKYQHVGEGLSWAQRITNLSAITIFWALVFRISTLVEYICHYLHLHVWQFMVLYIVYTVLVTIWMRKVHCAPPK